VPTVCAPGLCPRSVPPVCAPGLCPRSVPAVCAPGRLTSFPTKGEVDAPTGAMKRLGH
jgi:hypothetical protein